MITKIKFLMLSICFLIFTVCSLSNFISSSFAEDKPTSILDLFGNSSSSSAETFSTAEDSLLSPTLKIGVDIQTKFLADESADKKSSEFKIARARLKASGDINRYFSYNFMLGGLEPPPAADRETEIVNAFIDTKFAQYANFRIGQFFVPFGYEGPKAITKNDMIERSNLTALMNPFSIFRDIGVMLFGEAEEFNYSFSITNGAGANKNDDNNDKDLMGTLRYSPIKDLMVGLSGHLGSFGEHKNTRFNRKRWNVHIKCSPEKLTLIGEFTHREEEATRSNGFYALIGYHIFDDFQPVVRYTWIDQNLDGGKDIRKELSFGINYFYGKYVRIVVNYEIKDDDNNKDLENLFTLMVQVSY